MKRGRTVCRRKVFAFVAALLAAATPNFAFGEDAIVGVYRCQAGCRVTDAYPSVQTQGDVALCTNELGGIFHGVRLGPRSVACFHKIGSLSRDGKTLIWDSGMVWERIPGQKP